MKLSYLNSSGNVTGLDRFGRVSDQKWTNTAGATIDEYSYAYDRAGNRLSKTNALDAALNETYQYDNLDRLVQWALGGTTQKTWSLDALGNNLSAGTYNAANEETPTQGSSAYDAAGNMITLQSGNSAIYDAWNRLVEVDDTSGIVERYEYDGTGRRIQIFSSFSGSGMSTTANVQDDYYRGQQVVESDMTTAYNLATKSGTAAGGYQYLWSPRHIDAPILRDTLTTNRSGIVVADRVFYTADANYNVTGLLKYNTGTWQPVERYTYTPYGTVTYRNADWSTAGSSANGNTILYTGRTFDAAIGLYYYRARWYDPSLERFINRDPIGTKGGINLYEYCGDRPTIILDPQGLVGGPMGPLPYGPTYWPEYWNDNYDICYSNNCYSYACNRPFGPDGQVRPPGTKPQPGGGCAPTCASVIAAAKRDGLTTPNCKGDCPAGSHKVHLFVDPGIDYHWYRQDNNGSWSHKPGLGPCTNRDASGNQVVDPCKADRDYGRINYKVDCGELCAPN